MKEIINVELKTLKAEPDKIQTDLLAVGIFSDAKKLDKLNAQLDSKLDGAIERLIKLGDFKGKEGTSEVIYANGRIGAKRILLVGLGEKKKATLDTLRRAAANAAKKSVELKIENPTFALHTAFAGQLDLSMMGRAMAEGAYFGSYRYDEFVTESENGRAGRLEIEVADFDAMKFKKMHEGVAKGIIIGKAQSYARTVANRPGNVISPAKLAELAKEIVSASKNLTCEIFDEKRLAKEGMGGILAVGSGSQNSPRFIALRYNAAGKAAKKMPKVALVGKAITFDSGGISIKPATDMEDMKLDKTGGIAVMVTLKAVSDMRLPVNVVGLIPSAENLPSGTSYRPGDIVTTFSGKTVEVINTDAEGRMILCDALNYAVKENCDIIIDIATLTGACRVALGKYMAGLMGNDQTLIKQLQRAAEDSGEKVWPMPSGDEYAQEMKSKIADLKNTGSRFGGACTGAAFLRQFVGSAKWAHLDIAGMDMIDKATEFATEGASGFGVRLLTTYLMNLTDKKH